MLATDEERSDSAVDADGTVSVAGTGAATVTATVSAYGDTAVASARFAAFGEPSISDPAEDFSLASSQQGLEVTQYQERHGDGVRFRNSDPSTPGSVTYAVEDGVAAFRAITYVNNQEFDGSNDVYEGLPDDAASLRVTVSPSQNNWAANIGSIDVWASTANLGGSDATGPAILVDGVQAGDTYEAPHPASVSIADDQSSVTEQSVTLNGDPWSGGQLRARGRNVLAASATSEGSVTTDATLTFQVVNDEAPDLNARMIASDTEATVGDRLTFRVDDTTGHDTWIDSLSWSFDDGESGDGWWQSHRFAEPGTYTVALTATDNLGYSTTDEVDITVG